MLCLLVGLGLVPWSQVLPIFSKHETVTGLGYFTATRCRECLRTNNDLEHIFGKVRYHHRRCTGRFRSSGFTRATR